MKSTNPFAVTSPEDLDAERANQLFVEMYSDYPEITNIGNTIIFGARGCGKSMLIRCSLPDVLMKRLNKSFDELPYIAFNLPIRKTDLNLQELDVLAHNHIPFMLNEHFMVLYVMRQVFYQLSQIELEYDKEKYTGFLKLLTRKANVIENTIEIKTDIENPREIFLDLYEQMDELIDDFVNYLQMVAENGFLDFSFNATVFSYSRFVVPIIKKLFDLPGFNKETPFFIFIDDVDNLSRIQTEILNTWLSQRETPKINLKFSSQIGCYKTFLTTNKTIIESPHDYHSVNISYLYMGKNEEFRDRAVDIIEKRLKNAGINASATKFLPTDKRQDEAIKKEADKIRSQHKEKGHSKNVNDDIRRYAIPNYMKSLAGKKRRSYDFRYAGIDIIIHLSSGIIRYLLDVTGEMYDVEQRKRPETKIRYIAPDKQDKVIRKNADHVMFDELRRDAVNRAAIATTEDPINITDKLANLISAMGSTFREILMSERSERTVFSVALEEEPEKEVREVFRHGVKLGFFHESYIGNKRGDGRTYLYVLNRRFAPIFKLNPSGFHGYFFVTNKDIREAIRTGKKLRDINKRVKNENSDVYQLTLNDIWEE